MRTVVLDGRWDDGNSRVLDILLDELRIRGDEVQIFPLREMKTGTCIGCFRCWLETPGECVEADEGRVIARSVLNSDTVIILSPVTFGGYSSEIKKVQDRWIPLLLPDFGIFHGEIHHKPRYDHYPRWIGLGIQEEPDEEEAHHFRTLVGRNALNFHASSYSSDVVMASDSEANLRETIKDLIGREDGFPLGEAITSVLREAVAPDVSCENTEASSDPGRALLIIGSPKVGASTSGVLGSRVFKQLEQRGWETTTLTLRRDLLKEKGRDELIAEVKGADLILLAFPLYIDSLPFLLMKALEILAESLGDSKEPPPKRIGAIVNNGFAEPWHNGPAMAICRRFAAEKGLNWVGGLAMGAGEALFRGQPFEKAKRNAPPVDHVKQALDLAGAALADGQPIPAEAIRLIQKTPIPIMPFRCWRRLFIWTANRHWRRCAAKNQVGAKEILAQPYMGEPGVPGVAATLRKI